MHSLAIALKRAGHEVSGSDDQIYDPARSKLASHGLLPSDKGWDADRISGKLDAVILGMHAFDDNQELKKARELNLSIYSFPDYIYQLSKNKQRVVVAGSYGKTTVTSMIMHVLEQEGKAFDYLVGAEVPGFDNSVRLSEDAPVIIMEGDEYLASKLDPRPKFLLYKPHVCVITGISWDHINVFPTEEVYNKQFELLIKSLPKAADVIYNGEDKLLSSMVDKYTDKESQYLHKFKTPTYQVKEGEYLIKLQGERSQLRIIGKHNMANIAAAWEVCQLLAIEINTFLKHISTFTGAKSRMETVLEDENKLIIKDYAHAPAKVRATVEAVRERFKKHNLIACVELHTFSSLNKKFLPFYKSSLKKADEKIVYIDPNALSKRRMPLISRDELLRAFGDKNLVYVTSRDALKKAIRTVYKGKDVILMMSSGNFGGLKLESL